ncbi:GntR family transcriptional regulator [Kaistia terrae]|uniref:GntR family transcriptional regulator n=1 Tax=Kaistia terrae TaxID=537017 RepID=A0ABW0PSD7_9HYPH|nr:GntR family transcriptional regulator [Kaistia terrae]MCX5577686.1 GntR family transcriptional regulator [Kaistia terrae]
MTNSIGPQGDLPRYHQISNILVERIEKGRYAIGDLLPTEQDLCGEFEVSRYTIREALRRLTDAGLVRRRQGSGSQVVANKAPANFVHSMRSLSELFQYASDTVFKITKIEMLVPEPEVKPYLGDSGDEPWLYVEGVRLAADGRSPIAFSRVFVNREFEGIVPDLPGVSGTIFRLIEERYGVVVENVEQEIQAEPMGKYAAKLLDSSTRIWAVRVIRRYFGSDRKILQISVNYHPADRFSYSMQLRREGTKGWV